MLVAEDVPVEVVGPVHVAHADHELSDSSGTGGAFWFHVLLSLGRVGVEKIGAYDVVAGWISTLNVMRRLA